MSEARFAFHSVTKPEAIALGSVLPFTCLIMVGLRFQVRRAQKIRVGLDDWFAVCALLAIIGMGACVIAGACLKNMGGPTPVPADGLSAGEDPNHLDPNTIANEKIAFPFRILMIFAYGFVKLTIVAFYRRIFVIHRGCTFDILTKVFCVVVSLWTFAFILLVIFACRNHFWAIWGTTEEQTDLCPVALNYQYGLVVSDLILDGIVFLMPLPFIWNLQLTLLRKIAVSGIMLLGASAIGASTARLVLYVHNLKALGGQTVVDSNLSLTVAYYWCLLEVGVGLIAACLPTMSYFFTHRKFKNALSSVRSTFASSTQSLRRPSQPHSQFSQSSGSGLTKTYLDTTTSATTEKDDVDVDLGSTFYHLGSDHSDSIKGWPSQQKQQQQQQPTAVLRTISFDVDTSPARRPHGDLESGKGGEGWVAEKEKPLPVLPRGGF